MSGNIEEKYRKIRDFANDPTPIPWSMQKLLIENPEFLTKLDKDLVQYAQYKLKIYAEDKDAVYSDAEDKDKDAEDKNEVYENVCAKICAEVVDVTRLMHLKLDANSSNAATDPIVWQNLILERLLGCVKDLLPQPMQDMSDVELNESIFNYLSIYKEDSLDGRYNACVKFLENPEKLPGYMKEFLRKEEIMGSPIEHIIDEKSIHDLKKLNENPSMLGLSIGVNASDEYLTQCARICAENYYMKMCVNSKIGRGCLLINEMNPKYCKERTFLQKVKSMCVGEKYNYFDWDLLYNYVFQNLRRYMNQSIAKNGGLYALKGKLLNKKCQFIMDIYDIYYECYVVPENILNELPSVINIAKTKEMLDTLSQALVKKQSVGPGEQGDVQAASSYQAYISTVRNTMQRNKTHYNERFVSKWSEFQLTKFGGLHISDRPQNIYANKTKYYFEAYPPKTMDEIYTFCLMLLLNWDGVKKITALVNKFYTDLRAGAYQNWPEQERDFITPNYLQSIRNVNLSSLKVPGPNTDNERDKQIEEFFSGKYITDYAYIMGPSFNAKNLIKYLNDILEGKGFSKLPSGNN